jgi:predicted neutral ceramidase superfamily lipid hydrolase
MAKRKKGDFLKDLNPFSFGLPNPSFLFLIMLIISVVMGIGAVALLNHNAIDTNLNYIIANGAVTGIIVMMLPALLTVAMIKVSKRYIEVKYIAFVAIIGMLSYSVFILLSAITYIVLHSYALAQLIIIVGDASLFGWWFFASKIMMGRKKRNLVFALVHPTLNILLYVPYSSKIISFSTPFNILLAKLYAGIFIFMLVSYVIIFLVDRPYKKNFGFNSFDAFTQLIQDWLFNINTSAPFGSTFGTFADIMTDTLTMRGSDGKIRAVFFAPDIHYGPAGTIGGSDFPYMLERHVMQKYNATAFIMHKAVDMDSNPVSSAQYGRIRDALDSGVKNSKKVEGRFSYAESRHNSSLVARLGFGNVSLVSITRAPKVTEDISQGVAILFREMLETVFGTSIVVDAHNSRIESAPKEELEEVKMGSAQANDYIAAIRGRWTKSHTSGEIRAGFSSVELYHRLGEPLDIAKGNMNIAIFKFNGFAHAMVCINANNMLPGLRGRIIHHIKDRYGISAEVYTSDTHSVNSLAFEADNVVGRKTRFERLSPLIDKGIRGALADLGTVKVYHSRNYVKRFKVWGQNNMSQIITIAHSVYGFTKIMIPALVALGFLVAAWLISLI